MRGRGRGRTSLGPRAVARDDDNNVVEINNAASGPPPLYPERTLPRPFGEDTLVEYDSLVRRRRAIKKAYLNSPFHISASSKPSGKSAVKSVPLESIVTLDPAYFPPELYSSLQQSRSTSRAAQAAYWEQHANRKKDDADLDIGKRLEMLAKKESVEQRGNRRVGEEPELSGDVEEPQQNEYNEQNGILEEEDDFFEDDLEDDPYQQFDDDEGYEDLDEDDGGHDAYY